MVFKINDFGIPSSVLKGHDLRREVDDLANKIAEHAKSQGIMVEGEPGDIDLPVTVSSYTGRDRVRATVWLAHPAGAAAQAKNGVLSKAASAAGVEVKGD